VLVVTAEKERRVKWVKNRNGLSEHQIKSIMETQASDKERNDIADDIIENNGTKISLDGQVQKLDHKYRKIAGDPYVKPNT
ncbi:MAG: dephospho-CoA kinase, partial [Candidatus Scalindua sp.]